MNLRRREPLRPERREPRSAAEREARRLTAVLRWRSRLLLRAMPPATARAIRFLPAALQTSFPCPGLRDDAPGVEGPSFGRSWGALAGSLGLPAPVATRRGRRAVAAILVTNGDDGLIGWAVPAEGAGGEDRRRLDARVARLRELFEGRLELAVLDAEAPGAVPRLAAFGALIAGRVPPSFWPADEELEGLDAEGACRLAVEAPTPLAALAVALLARAAAPHPVVALRQALASGLSARALADPELFACLWAGAATGRREPLLRALEFATRDRTSAGIAGSLRDPSARAGREARRTAGRLVALGRELSIPAIRAASRAPASCRRELRRRLRREAVEAGAPVFLLPVIGRALVDAGIRAAEEVPPLTRSGGVYVVEDGARGVLARGRTPAQAWLRATALAGRALAAGAGSGPRPAPVAGGIAARPPALDRTAPAPGVPGGVAAAAAPWGSRGGAATGTAAGGTGAAGPSRGRRTLAEAVVTPVARRTLILRVEAAEVPGPPFDPLNRGPDRLLGFGPCQAVVLRPGYRPSARSLPPAAVVPLLLAETRAGAALELTAGGAAAEPAASRLDRLIRRAAAPRGECPPALQAGGRVYLVGERIRRFPAGRFAVRPRRCDPDPEAPDLGAGAPSPTGPAVPPGRLECRVSRAGADRASLLYLDEHGQVLREEVPLAGLEEWLRETQALLRLPPRPVALALRTGDGLEVLAGRRLRTAPIEVPAKVFGTLPFGIGIELRGERFGGGSRLGWRAAALTALAAWPPGATGRIRVEAVEVDVAGEPASGLLRLYARNLAVRRLDRQVRWQLDPGSCHERVEDIDNPGAW